MLIPLTSAGGHLLFTTETVFEGSVEEEGAFAGNEGIPKDAIKPPAFPSAEVIKAGLTGKAVFRLPRGFLDKPLSPNTLIDGRSAAAAAAGRKEKEEAALSSKPLFLGCAKEVD